MVVSHRLLGMYVCFNFDAGVVIVIGQFQVLSEFQLSFSFSFKFQKTSMTHISIFPL